LIARRALPPAFRVDARAADGSAAAERRSRVHAGFGAFAFGAGGAFDSEYPHFPQERRFGCSARNIPGPHFGHDLWVRVRESPLTS
jgi:hypothetical protein